MKKLIFSPILVLIFSLPSIGFAISLDSLEEEEETDEVLGGNTIEWSGLFDVRLANAGGDKNWADQSGEYGGPGLTRYGSGPGRERSTNFHLGMIGLVADILIDEEVAAHIQLNYSDHRSGSKNDWGGLGIAEAYIAEHFSLFEMRLGFLIPPISLEHPEVAWSTKYTITPSAINSWVGEEVRSLGIELNAKISDNLEFMVAGFSHNDAIATMLTYRGWALHDYQGTYGTRLRWNKVPDEINETGGWVEPFKELDDKLGLYSQLVLASSDKSSSLKLFYYNNFANPSRFDGSNYAWKTEFWNLSFSQQFASGVEFLAQYMLGETEMGPVEVVHAKFNAYYFLASYKMNKSRFSVRFDKFEVTDEDSIVFPSGATDLNDSKGKAMTAAYLYNLSDQRIVGAEFITVKSERNGNEGYGNTDPDDDLFQFMYRLTI